MNNYSLRFDFSNLSQIIKSFWIDIIQHYFTFWANHVKLFVSVPYDLFCFTIWIASFWVVSIYFRFDLATNWIPKSTIRPNLNKIDIVWRLIYCSNKVIIIYFVGIQFRKHNTHTHRQSLKLYFLNPIGFFSRYAYA